MVQDQAGNLYGTTGSGGLNNPECFFGCGVVFQLTPNADGTWTEAVFHTFTGGADGAYPTGGLLTDSQGNLYGTAYEGGSAPFGFCGYQGFDICGVVFKFDSSGNETVLWDFTGGSDGANSSAGLAMDAEGNLYGTTTYGGDLNSTNPACVGFGCGVVFRLTP